MKRGWEVEYKDGKIVNEDQVDWMQLPKKKDIVRLSLKWDGRQWDLKGRKAYIQKKRAMSIPGRPETFIIARYIGYYDEGGVNKILYRVCEFTGQMTLQVIEG
jgi:hypothetical protein